MRIGRRTIAWLWGNVLGILIMVYFVIRIAVLMALWIVCGPLALIFMLFGSELILDLLAGLLDGMDRVAKRVWDVLDFLPDDD